MKELQKIAFNKLKSKAFGILLMLCFLAPLASTFVIHQIQKKQIKKALKQKIIAGLNKKELLLFKFTEKEKQTQLEWEHSKEFEYKGEMYDVIETKIIGNTTYYWVWWDCEETKLNRKLNELVTLALGNNPQNQENQKRLNHFLKSLYFTENAGKESLVFIALNNKNNPEQEFYHLVAHPPLLPPPKKS